MSLLGKGFKSRARTQSSQTDLSLCQNIGLVHSYGVQEHLVDIGNTVPFYEHPFLAFLRPKEECSKKMCISRSVDCLESILDRCFEIYKNDTPHANLPELFVAVLKQQTRGFDDLSMQLSLLVSSILTLDNAGHKYGTALSGLLGLNFRTQKDHYLSAQKFLEFRNFMQKELALHADSFTKSSRSGKRMSILHKKESEKVKFIDLLKPKKVKIDLESLNNKQLPVSKIAGYFQGDGSPFLQQYKTLKEILDKTANQENKDDNTVVQLSKVIDLQDEKSIVSRVHHKVLERNQQKGVDSLTLGDYQQVLRVLNPSKGGHSCKEQVTLEGRSEVEDILRNIFGVYNKHPANKILLDAHQNLGDGGLVNTRTLSGAIQALIFPSIEKKEY